MRHCSVVAVFACAALPGMTACRAGDDPAIGERSAAVISDRVHGGGTPGFYWLPPMVPQPVLEGTLDTGLSPTVRVDQIDPVTSTPVRTLATFTRTSGPGSVITVGAAGYHVNWDSTRCDFGPCSVPLGPRARINALLDGRLIGFADVDLVLSQAQARTVDKNLYVPLVNGKKLSLNFFMNGCVPLVCTAADACHVAGVCDPSTGTCSNPSVGDGTACGTNRSCIGGICKCSNGLTACGSDCVALDTTAHCGACGNVCTAGQDCCGGACIDVGSDVGNCGACGVACGAGQGCCGGACADLTSNVTDCGACGVACGAGQGCCGGACIGLDSDPGNCGGCGVACGAGQSCCSSSCTSLGTTSNCGACGNACGAGQDCCASTCTSLSTVTSCGACNNACAPVANATLSCSAGACVATCDAGYVMAGGACVLPASCSSGSDCPVVANGTNSCVSGNCVLSCDTGYTLSGGACVAACQASPDPVYAWSPHTTQTSTGAASAPTIKTAGGQSNSYFTQGTTLFAVRNVAEPGCTVGDCAAGGIRWTWQPAGATSLSGPPLLATVSGTDYVFVAGDGVVYRRLADDGTGGPSYDTHRLSGGLQVCAGDDVVAPLVSLVDSTGEVIVFVITYTQCRDNAENRVIALHGSDLTPKWIFNSNLIREVGNGTVCTTDAASGTVFCGVRPAIGSAANTLLAFNAETGTLRWAANAGSIAGGLALFGGRIYVAGEDGALMAYVATGPSGGNPLWASPLVMPAGFFSPPVLLNGPSEPASTLLLLDTTGVLRVVDDIGTSGVILAVIQAEGAVKYTGLPAFVPSLDRIYAPRSDGLIQQINPIGIEEGTALVATGATVFAPAADVESAACAPNRLVVAAWAAGSPGQVTRIILPLSGQPPAE